MIRRSGGTKDEVEESTRKLIFLILGVLAILGIEYVATHPDAVTAPMAALSRTQVSPSVLDLAGDLYDAIEAGPLNPRSSVTRHSTCFWTISNKPRPRSG